MQWTNRFIGFVSTLILARLLVPDDFGLIAMGTVVVGLVDMLLDLGVNVALIQNRNAAPAHYNTAWTIRLAQAAIAALIVFFAAPFFAQYFHDPRVELVLQLMAAGMLIGGLENIGVITFQKEMRFGLDFRFAFFKRIFGFIVTIVAAWLLRSYWALVIGALAGRCFGVFLSYHMHPMRPRFSIEKLKELFLISQWMLAKSIGSYLNGNLDKVLVGRRINTTMLGGYTLADEISAMPSSEVLAPLNRVLFPAFVQAKHDLTKLKELFLQAQAVQCLLAFPAAIGAMLVAKEAVFVLLGEKWLFVVPFVQVLSMVHLVNAIITSGGYVMLTLGKVHYLTIFVWVQVAFFAFMTILIYPDSTALQIAWLRILTVYLGLFLAIYLLMRSLKNVRLLNFIRSVFRPFVGVIMMTIGVLPIAEILDYPPVATLLLKIVIGLIIYPVVILTLWWIAGRPPGAESYLLGKIETFLDSAKKSPWVSRFLPKG